MNICHVTTPAIYKEFPEILNGNSYIFIRENDILHTTINDAHYISNQNNVKVVLWLNHFIPKNEIYTTAIMIGAKKIIYPVTSLNDIHELERMYVDSNLSVIATIIADTERDYMLLLHNVLKSKVIKGVGLDYIHMLNAFGSFSLPLFALRARVIEHTNVLIGLSLYDKEIYCLRMCGALPEILLLKNYEYVYTLVTDSAITLALNNIKIDDSSLLPVDFNMDFVNKNSIDCSKAIIVPENIKPVFDLVKYNIKIMEEHNE